MAVLLFFVQYLHGLQTVALTVCL